MLIYVKGLNYRLKFQIKYINAIIYPLSLTYLTLSDCLMVSKKVSTKEFDMLKVNVRCVFCKLKVSNYCIKIEHINISNSFKVDLFSIEKLKRELKNENSSYLR